MLVIVLSKATVKRMNLPGFAWLSEKFATVDISLKVSGRLIFNTIMTSVNDKSAVLGTCRTALKI